MTRKDGWTKRQVAKGLIFALLAAATSAPAGALASELQRNGTGPARSDSRVVVYSVLSTAAAQPLIEDFEARFPGIKVEYDGEKGSNDMDARFRSEIASGQPSADVVWSSATDMQLQLVAEGFAARYRSPHSKALPRWAKYGDMAYGVTLEPVALVYNRRQLSETEVPRDHKALVQLLRDQKDRFTGKVTGFNITSSGVGFMFAAQDRRHNSRFDELLAQLGDVAFRPLAGTGDMLTRINSGEFLLGYNMMGSYALSRSNKDLPNIGVVFPSDYTLAFPRVAFISKHAQNPTAARLWLDYLLSPRGQEMLARSVKLFPVRDDLDAVQSGKTLSAHSGASLRTIPVRLNLIEDIKPDRKRKLLEQWSRAVDPTSGPKARMPQ